MANEQGPAWVGNRASPLDGVLHLVWSLFGWFLEAGAPKEAPDPFVFRV